MARVQKIDQLGLLARVVLHNNLLIGLVVVHLLAAVITGYTTGVVFDPSMTQTLLMLFSVLLPWFAVVLVFRYLLILMIYEKPDKPIARFVSDMKALVSDTERLLGGVLRMALITLFISTFSYFKALVPFLNPFGWDVAFADLDRALHFGRAPYQWLAPVFGNPWATTVLNAAYHFWFFLLYFVVFLASFSVAKNRSGIVFLIAFTLVFAIGGNFLATIFSSAGPVYFERLGYGAEFVPLMENLKLFQSTSPVWALAVQETLWQSHIATGPISGISAMPSMHVASTTLIAIYGFQYSRWAGISLSLFAVTIMIGSVQLGWHYAVDGYFGAILALVCWRVAHLLTSKVHSQKAIN
ncbi:MAG: phosphatase PAP2 family protein [Paracoccaceae bacterium]